MARRFLTPLQAPGLYNDGQPNAATSTRYVGGTASGAPSAGTWLTGDWVVAANGHIWICTAGGTPGTWADASAGGGGGTPATTVQTENGLDAGQVGTATNYAREDHRHPITNLVDLSTVQTITAQKVFNNGALGASFRNNGQPHTTFTDYGVFASVVEFLATQAATATNVAVDTALALKYNYWTGSASAQGSVFLKASAVDGANNSFLYISAGTTRVLQLFAAQSITATDVITANGGITVPSGEALTTGTRSVVTGVRATTTQATDTVDIGTFTSTGGAIELRVHAHLAAPAAGTTASVTKVYEIAVNATMGTANTWYKVLPADMSGVQQLGQDFALEVQRRAGNNFDFRFRQISISVAGQITFIVETLGDVPVTFAPSNAVTTAPAAVTALHLSNPLVAAAGLVGIGTDAPGQILHLKGGQGSVSAITRMDGASAGSSGLLLASNASAALASVMQVATSAQVFGDTAVEDLVIQAVSGKTVHIGTASGLTKSTLKVTATDVLHNDNGTIRSAPRGFIGAVSLTANYAPAASLTNRVLVSSGSAVAVLVAGRRYKVTFQHYGGVATAGAFVSTGTVLLNASSVAQGGTPAGTVICTADLATGQNAGYQFGTTSSQEFTCAASGGDITPGSYFIIIAAVPNQAANVTTWGGGTTPASTRNIAWIEDIGT